MKRITALSIFAFTIAASSPALANDQLANSLGVEPGALSTAEMLQLKGAIEDDNTILENYIRSNAGSSGWSSRNSLAHAQLAASLGVDHNEFSTAELVALRNARDDSDAYRANAIRKHSVANQPVSSSNGAVSVGRAQLADSWHVDVNDYTLPELVAIHTD